MPTADRTLRRNEPDQATPLRYSRMLIALADSLAAGRECFARLAAFGHRLSRHREAAPLLDEAADLLRQLLEADEAWVSTVEAEHTTLRAVSGADDAPAHGTSPRPRALVRTPVVHDGALVAVLFAARPAHHPFPAHAVEAARVFADHLAVALANASHFAQLRTHAVRDPLTGLANRTEAGEQLDRMLGDPASGRVGVLFCDLDQFKVVNDRLGHEAGDELLRQVSTRLREHVRPGDLLARFGGDEFVLAVPGLATVDEVTEVGRRLSRVLAGAYRVAGELVRPTASVGGVLGTAGDSDASTLLRGADAAMYAAKQRGPGRVTVHDEAETAHARAKLDLSADVPFALERGELELYYQPVVATVPSAHPGASPASSEGSRSGSAGDRPPAAGRRHPEQVVAFEALLRWHHPTRGTVAPDVLVPLAEESGQMAAIGDWVLAQACQQLATWRREAGAARWAVSVNLSADQLAEPDAAERILATIRTAGVAPQDVWLEVTEHRFRGDGVANQAARLRDAGVRFVLDDFGGVCSSLAFLRQLPIELLKVDLRLVTEPTGTALDTGLVQALLAVAHALGLTMVAEGVETAAQQRALADLGCPFGQGYFWSAPAPAPVVAGALRELAAA